MRSALVLGFALGLIWSLMEVGLAQRDGSGEILAAFATYVALGTLGVLAAHVALAIVPRTKPHRAVLACALAAAGIAMAVVFVRAHFGWLANQRWTSGGHLTALGGALGAGIVAGILVRFAAKRIESSRWARSTLAGTLAGILVLCALFPAMKAMTPRFDASIEGPAVKCTAPYNVLLITLDTLRADHLKSYGYAPPTDALGRFGFTRFENMWAASPWTRPSTATILTGSYPSTHTTVSVESSLPRSAVTLAERLDEQGFVTAHCAANLNASGVFGMSQGAQFTIKNPYVVPHPLSGTTLGELLRRRTFKLQDARDLERMALAFLDAAQGRRFFLYAHFEDPHTPYDPPSEQLEKFAPGFRGKAFKMPRRKPAMTKDEVRSMVARYDGDIANATEAVARLLDELERRGELEHTLVILTADHGEAFDDHGHFNHSDSLYQELLSIPLLVRPPGGLGRVASVHEVASQIDLVPTVLDYLRIARPPGLPGVSLRRWIEGSLDDPAQPRLLLAECQRIGAWSVRLGNWKLIATGDEPTLELYDLEKDSRELTNLAAQLGRYEAIARTLLQKGLELREELAAQSLKAESHENGREVKGLLNQLGYGGDDH